MQHSLIPSWERYCEECNVHWIFPEWPSLDERICPSCGIFEPNDAISYFRTNLYGIGLARKIAKSIDDKYCADPMRRSLRKLTKRATAGDAKKHGTVQFIPETWRNEMINNGSPIVHTTAIPAKKAGKVEKI